MAFSKHWINLSYISILGGLTLQTSEKLMRPTDPWTHNSCLESNSRSKWRKTKVGDSPNDANTIQESRNEKGVAQAGGSLTNKTWCGYRMRKQQTAASNMRVAMHTEDKFIKHC